MLIWTGIGSMSLWRAIILPIRAVECSGDTLCGLGGQRLEADIELTFHKGDCNGLPLK